MAENNTTPERKRSYGLTREGDNVTYTVKEIDGDASASVTFSLSKLFGITGDGLAADAICSAIRAAARYAVAAKDATDWQTALDDLIEQWNEGDWSVSGEGSVPFGVGAPLTKAVLSVYGDKFDGSAMAAAKGINEKLLANLTAQQIAWDDLTDAEKNKARRAFEKAVTDADPRVALFLAELYAAQAADRAQRKLAQERAKLAAGGGASLF